MSTSRIDPCILNAWHVVGAISEMVPQQVKRTRLLGNAVAVMRMSDAEAIGWLDDGAAHLDSNAPSGDPKSQLPLIVRYGYVWISLGKPNAEVFPIPEIVEPGRCTICAASIGVHVSAPRMVENFLDIGHLPFVHTGILGAETHTEVRDYDVEVSAERDEILVRCLIYLPKSSPKAPAAADVPHVYRVPHPYCVMLYKMSTLSPPRMDIVAMFVQPLDEEHACAHVLVSRVDDEIDEMRSRAFQLRIFGQDKPIIENQFPKRLPLDPRAELPVRSDASSLAYRRWLRDKGVTYGTIPHQSSPPDLR
jgi:phenylpropionate dioxygenase-like ring-hydroxylating dioxygenase large terminal subunit